MSGSSEAEDAVEQVRRGVKKYTKRGKYVKQDIEKRRRVIKAAENFQDWRSVAAANGVSYHTAYNWIRRGNEVQPMRGSVTMRKVSDETVEKMISYVEEDAIIILKMISEKLHVKTGLKLALSTVHKYLEGKMYTVKKILVEPCTMNN